MKDELYTCSAITQWSPLADPQSTPFAAADNTIPIVPGDSTHRLFDCPRAVARVKAD
jgi:hypothetical protein